MTSYVNPYTGQTINPSQVGYESITTSTDVILEWPINGNSLDVVANILDITTTAVGIKIFMPPAESVSVGQATLIRNKGANSFTVVNTSGGTIVVIASSLAEYIYVTDNTTINGTWGTLAFGAGTSTANAADLAGYGLNAVSTTLNTVMPPFTVSSPYTVLPSAQSQTLVWIGGSGYLTLPSAASVTSGWFLNIKNDGTGTLTVYPIGADTIDGDSYFQLQPAESITIVSNLSSWVSYGYGQSSLFVFTQLVLNVTSGVYTLTQSQAANLIQEYQGTLTGNVTIILPPVVSFYAMTNNTTGTFTLTFSTGVSGGQTISLGQSQTVILICDGTNVFNAQSANSNVFTSIQIGQGSAAAPSLSFTGDTNTGLYLAATHEMGIALNGSSSVLFTPSGILAPIGIAGGSI